jgi:hypothetical protein
MELRRTLAHLLIADGRLAEAQQVLAMLKEQEFYDFTQASADADPRKTVAGLSSPEKELDDLNGKDVALGREYGLLQEKFQRGIIARWARSSVSGHSHCQSFSLRAREHG